MHIWIKVQITQVKSILFILLISPLCLKQLYSLYSIQHPLSLDHWIEDWVSI